MESARGRGFACARYAMSKPLASGGISGHQFSPAIFFKKETSFLYNLSLF